MFTNSFWSLNAFLICGAMLSAESSYCGSDPTLEETPTKSITRLVVAVVAVMFAVATLCPAQAGKSADLGKGTAFNGKKIEMKDKGEVAYLLSFTAGKESRPLPTARRIPRCTFSSTTPPARKSLRTTRPDRSVRLRSRRRRTGSTSSSSRTPGQHVTFNLKVAK